jgi:hypothetical protein
MTNTADIDYREVDDEFTDVYVAGVLYGTVRKERVGWSYLANGRPARGYGRRTFQQAVYDLVEQYEAAY